MIANAVGISQPSLYAHFATKEALTNALSARAFASLEDLIAKTPQAMASVQRDLPPGFSQVVLDRILGGLEQAVAQLALQPNAAHASEFASIFSTLHEQYRCLPADALVIAYRMYAERCPRKPTVSFDRAFALVCDLLGIWLRKEARLAMHRCPRCRARYVAEIGAAPPRESGCVFCHLLQRYTLDARLQAHYVARRADLPTILARPDGTGPEKAA
eukprot:gene35772-40466_t